MTSNNITPKSAQLLCMCILYMNGVRKLPPDNYLCSVVCKTKILKAMVNKTICLTCWTEVNLTLLLPIFLTSKVSE